MKALALVLSLFVAPCAFAILGVEDTVEIGPITSGIQAAYHAEDLVKLAAQVKGIEDQIQNQIQQIEQAKNLLNVQNSLKATIGDWQGVVARAQSIKLQAANLTTDHTLNLRNTLILDYGNPDLDPKNGFGTPFQFDPTQIERDEQVRRVAAEAYETLKSTDVEAKEVNVEIADTYKRMTESGLTQQEFEKLNAKVQALTGRLNALQMQRAAALAMITAQKNTADTEDARRAAVAADQIRETSKAVTDAYLGIQIDEPVWK